MDRLFRLIITCPDRVGIVAKVGEFISGYGGWITEANHYADRESGWFFMRHSIRADSLPFGVEEFKAKFATIAKEFQMNWRVTDSQQAKRMLLMASKESHCLADLLHRWHTNELQCDIPAVVSNHEQLRSMVEWYGIPFHCIPIDPDNREGSFQQVAEVIDRYQVDLVVLARYMQILDQDLCHQYAGRIINIHHSFLPSFVGARPYHQAYEKGVKLIGATCHYVTADLDQGPIISQDVVPVSHNDSVDDMVRLGKDVEKLVLSRGVRAHLEDRILLHGNKTIVF